MMDPRRFPTVKGPFPAQRLWLPCIVLATVALSTASCRPERSPEPEELLTEEVSLPPDALVDPALDIKEKRRSQESLAGQLPSNFPKDLPTFPGATVVDFSESGAPWIEMLAPASGREVAKRYESLLGAAGWTASGTGPAGTGLAADGQAHTYTSGGRSVSLRLDTQGPSCKIRISY
ncbi:MAG: hypothetical protein K8J08_11620 [Thermoanaerobaculia bacterium]|nr:hypothetical protein [Thermoanaerobaculia bacterium]